MIKCEVEVCGKITRAASIKQKSDGTEFLGFGIQVNLKDRDGKVVKAMDISVSIDGGKSEKSIYALGRKVKLLGNLSVRKKGDQTYYNLRADKGSEIVTSKEEDAIEGNMFFRGKIGKRGVEEHQTQKGNTYKTFSAFSSDKEGDNISFIWVRFIYFNPKDDEGFLHEDSYVEVTGDLNVKVYKENINLDCNVKEIKEYHFKNE